MPLTKFPAGVSSYGVPLLGGSSLPTTTGNYFFVDSGAGGTSAGRAADPSNPANTADAAYNLVTASNGDVVVVMPGHSEVIGAAGLAMDTAGVTVVGLGVGHTRPQFNYDANTGTVTITASNQRLSGIVFDASVAAVATGVIADNTISHIEIDNCRWTWDATGVEFTVMLKLGNGATDSCDYVNVHDNWFEAEYTDGCGSAILIDDCTDVHIINNLVTGDFNSVAIDGAAASSATKNYVIAHNIVQNIDTGLTIDLDDAATGIAAHNWIAGGGAIAGICDWGNLLCVENYVCDVADTSGVLVPSTTSA